jgi:ABC-type nitrate/sulfonate/bicarbonate transport system substrate-binding protein
MCEMTNLTLRIDEELLARARRFAAERGTTVAEIVRGHLAAVTNADDRAAAARRTLAELAERAQSRAVDWKWSRDEIYAERLSRLQRHPLRGAAAEERTGKGAHSAGFAEDD